MDTQFSGLPAFIWSVADLLRGEFKQSQYGRIIPPRPLEAIDADLDAVTAEIMGLLQEVHS